MSREDLINVTRAILARAGFDISPALNLRSVCFDVVGRRDRTLLLIKILSNIDAFSRENGSEMKVLAEALGASPLLIGERSSAGALEPGIVYSRFGIPIISNETLADHLLEEVPPFMFAAPGGLYVKLDRDLLRLAREKRGVSLGTLAETAGVSRRTIQMYEAGMGAMIDAALRLEEFLGVPIIAAVDPFEYKQSDPDRRYEITGNGRTGSNVLDRLLDIGFAVTPIQRGPFDALTRGGDTVMITGLGNEEDKVVQKATIASDISRISGRYSVIIVDNHRGLENIRSTAVVTKEEIKKMDDRSELTDLVLERSGKA